MVLKIILIYAVLGIVINLSIFMSNINAQSKIALSVFYKEGDSKFRIFLRMLKMATLNCLFWLPYFIMSLSSKKTSRNQDAEIVKLNTALKRQKEIKSILEKMIRLVEIDEIIKTKPDNEEELREEAKRLVKECEDSVEKRKED